MRRPGATSTFRPEGRRPRPGWYAFRPTATIELPQWVVEVALTVERPAQGPPYWGEAQRQASEGRAGPDLGWGPGSVPGSGPGLGQGRTWGGEEAIHSVPERPQGGAEAVLLLRAPASVPALEALIDAAVAVEAAAGLGPVRGPRLMAGRAVPGLTPIPPAAARAQLAAAGSRGLHAPLRRRQPAAGWTEPSWRASTGSVLTCDGPGGTSAQAVIMLRPLGREAPITPPPGGALVVRAWRGRRSWGLACGLVLGSAAALGLGREAGRAAVNARAAGWDAAVLTGATALLLARAGDPAHPPPEAAAHAASSAQVAALIEACLAAARLDRPAAGSQTSWP